MAIKTDFRRTIDSQQAYDRLKQIFAAWQGHKDSFDILTVREWLEPDSDTSPLRAARVAMGTALGDPALDMSRLLRQAEEGAASLTEKDRGNLESMKEIFASSASDPAAVNAHADTLEGASARFWAIKAPVDALYIKESRYKQKLDAQKGQVTHRQQNRLATYKVRLQAATDIAFQEMKALMIPQVEAKRVLLRKASLELGIPPSEVALREWNPGAREKDIDHRFESVRAVYPRLMETAEAKKKEESKILPLPPIDVKKQEKLLIRLRNEIISAGGYDPREMEADGIKSHFELSEGLGACWGTPAEHYMVVYAEEKNPLKGVMYVAHETGHLLQMLGLRKMGGAYHDQPVGRINGYGVYEISAMTMDILTSGRKFFELAAPIIREELGVSGPEWEAENLYRLAQRKESTDWSAGGLDCLPEVAWRDKARKILYNSDLKVADAIDCIPHIWAETMTEYTGQFHEPKDFLWEEDHPFTDMFGYYEAYMAGAEGAAIISQIVQKRGFDDSKATTLKELVAPYAAVLQEHIHSKGRSYPPAETMERALKAESLPTKPRLGPWLQRLGADAVPISLAAAPALNEARPG